MTVEAALASKYLDFKEIADTGKTKVWAVMSVSGGYRLAKIKWHGPWRCYVFVPDPETVWNVDCLVTVNNFIRRQMDLRKQT